ncbi:hypothetical protein D3C75_1107010 [compost metagenome]
MRRAGQDAVHFAFDDIPLAEAPHVHEAAEHAKRHHEEAVYEHNLILAPSAKTLRMHEDDQDKDEVGCLKQQIRHHFDPKVSAVRQTCLHIVFQIFK